MATKRTKRTKYTVTKADVEFAMSGSGKKRVKTPKVYPALPEGSKRYTGFISVRVDAGESLPPVMAFKDSLHYWSTAVTYYTDMTDFANAKCKQLQTMTSSQRKPKIAPRDFALAKLRMILGSVDDIKVRRLMADNFIGKAF